MRRFWFISIAAVASFCGGHRYSASQARKRLQPETVKYEFVYATKQESTGLRAQWRLQSTEASRTAVWTQSPDHSNQAVLTTPGEHGDTPFPVTLRHPLKTLLPDDLVLFRFKVRGITQRTAQAFIVIPGRQMQFLTPVTPLSVSKAWQEVQIVWRMNQGGQLAECSLDFDAAPGQIELADVRLVRLNEFASWLPLPDVARGGVRVFQRPTGLE